MSVDLETQADQVTPEEFSTAYRSLWAEIKTYPYACSGHSSAKLSVIQRAWRQSQSPNAKYPEIAAAVANPKVFIDKCFPRLDPSDFFEPVTPGQILRALTSRVGSYIDAKNQPQEHDYMINQAQTELESLPQIDLSKLGIHETTSVTLPGIAKYHALLSSKILIDLGEPIQSGESLDNFPDAQVFAYPGTASDAQGRPNWFNEHRVIVGISLPDQQRYLTAQGMEIGRDTDHANLLGPQVPLENISLVSSPAANLESTRAWTQRNCPQATVISREALKVGYGI